MTAPSVCVNCGKRSLNPICIKCSQKASRIRVTYKKGYHVTCKICGKRTKTLKKELANDEFVCPSCKVK